MKMMAQARRDINGTFSLIGVAPTLVLIIGNKNLFLPQLTP